MRNCFVDSLKDLSTIQICVHLFSGWTTGHHYTCESLCAYVTERVCVCVFMCLALCVMFVYWQLVLHSWYIHVIASGRAAHEGARR